MQDTSIALLESLVDRSNQQAWEQFFNAYGPRMENWLVRHGVSPKLASDIRQESLQTLLEELPKFQHNDNRGAFRLWIDRIAQNAWRRVARRRTPQPVEAKALEPLADENSDFSRSLREDYTNYGAALMHKELEFLREEMQPNAIDAFIETTIKRHRIEPTAKELGMTRGAVATARSRVLARLRERIQGALSGV